MEKHFVEFFWPGIMFAESSIKNIDSWDPDKAIKMIKDMVKNGADSPYGFRFITRSRNDDELDSKITSTSGAYYINGIIRSLKDIEDENNPNNKILLSNMRCNGWDRVVQILTPRPWTMYFKEEDQIISMNPMEEN